MSSVLRGSEGIEELVSGDLYHLEVLGTSPRDQLLKYSLGENLCVFLLPGSTIQRVMRPSYWPRLPL